MSDRPVAVAVTGGDASLISEEAHKIIDELAGGQDHNLVVEELRMGEEVQPTAIVDACRTPPFLGDRRIVVVRDAGALDADGAAAVLDYLAEPLDTTSLVIIEGGGKIGTKLINAVKKVGRVVAIGDLTKDAARRSWIDDHISHAGVKFDRAAKDVLSEHLGEDLGRLRGLLEILETTYGTGAKVSVNDVMPFLGEAGDVAPFALIDHVDAGDYEKALRLTRRLVGAGRHPLALLAILHRHYAAMLRLDGLNVRSKDQAGEILGMHPFPAGKAMAAGRRLGTDRVAESITLLADADLDIRGNSELPPEAVLEVLVARLCSRAGRRGGG